MAHLNIEFKASAKDIDALQEKLAAYNPRYIGEDRQIDTYFNVSEGRLKLREGNIENALIYYNREDIAGAKQSDVLLYKHLPDATLKEILERLHGIKVVVSKRRKIYFIDNVKFHFDVVEELGTFVEVEAIDKDGTISPELLQQQCAEYAALFEIQPGDYISVSYSDLLLAKEPSY